MKFRKFKNHLFTFFILMLTLLTLVPLFLILKHLFLMGFSSLSFDFILNTPKGIGELGGGMSHAILGSLLIMGMASLMAIPTGLAAGAFLSEFSSSRLVLPLRLGIDLLSGTPSIVIGIFAYVLFVVPWKSFSALSGSMALTLIIIPIVTRSTEQVLKLVPTTVREAGLAIGLQQSQVIWHILLKGHKKALSTGVILAISRAMGETAPLLFTAFGNTFLSSNIFAPMATLPVQIFNYASSPYEEWQQQAWTGAILLISIVFTLNLTSRLILGRKK